MPVVPSNHNVIKIGKHQYRNPIYLARGWQESLDKGEYSSAAELALHFKVSRARVTQMLNLLQLSPEVIQAISLLGDPLRSTIVAERRLRPLLALNAEQQKAHVEIMLSK